MAGFPPLVSDDPRWLILGSMPGQRSLSEQQYYAHPRNSFWWVVSEIFAFDHTSEYPARVRALTESRVAVWDVLHNCARPGSLDSDIVRTSEQPNNIQEFLSRYPTINMIAFNGGAAKTIFMRHCQTIIELHPEIQLVQLPSTSPAFASMSRDEKLSIWRRKLISPMFSSASSSNE